MLQPRASASGNEVGLGERAIFVADRPWRHRAVSAAVAAGGVLLLVWLAAIVAGALGFGSLPALPFVSSGSHAAAPSAAPAARDAAARTTARHGTAIAGAGARAHRSGPLGTAARRAAASGGPWASAGRRSGSSSTGLRSGSGTGTSVPGSSSPAAGGGAAATAPGGGTSTGTGTGTGGGTISPSHPSASGPPAATPSGNAVPSGSASEPSPYSDAAREGELGKGRSKTIATTTG